jgi:C4-dicarboxylate transporter, DctQ subunit
VLIRVWHRLEEGFIAFLLAAMTLLTFTQVVLRYVFNSGFVWALEGTTYLFAWLVLFGMSYGVRVGSHIGVDAVVKLLPPKGQRVVGLLAILLSLVYCVILFVGAWNYTDTMMTIGIEAEDIPVERWMLSIILPIGFLLLGLRLAEAAVRIIRGRDTVLRLGDEATEALQAYSAEQSGAAP